ncbi:glycolipid 2-alpha-mannosyltransferase 1 [Echria macrotheca]|uniref:Glycolipid 2-alpha-mannosyltransferase 1 n=1 Tax=Echria macrotheca TaxID=438768 RepID=A0AAJ0F953_9PEZI|nr:glycolipid 2-alpha-mannosyltransferase 1 [Echria macrotheca]
MVLATVKAWPVTARVFRLRRPHLSRRVASNLKVVLCVLVALLLESLLHVHRHAIPRPPKDLDAPFSTQCQDPVVAAAATPRENATLVMLARNNELQKALQAVQNIEHQFNQWFHYPILFLNDEEWDAEFKRVLSSAVSGEATFEVIERKDWGFPSWMDVDAARIQMKAQEAKNIYNGGKESYHHMCRFFSGTFYEAEALKKYKWYWRVEPGVEYTCAITYDPFVEMARRGKTYGYVVSLWEVDETVPSLFRTVDGFRRAKGIGATPNWRAMIQPSWAPWPIRRVLGWFGANHRDYNGDIWNLCHYWSNFEIADLDFFRSDVYRDLFGYLDHSGGFYSERWGDASVHALAVHLLLGPEQLHHFADIGYSHEPFWQCPGNAPGGQLLNSTVLGDASGVSPESEHAIGCRCRCPDERRRNNRGICLNTLQAPAAFHRPTFAQKWRGEYPYTINIPSPVPKP